ncbi:MAG: hypothetical protein A2Y38_07655 [Spirochaetes bacterium GWB1_59_5]|nr:MAG: hypothetical protein A2Y38_07655 [Spirochaetes bacterium GWB1_59_5]
MILRADARMLPLCSESVDCIVTSPPYWGLRDYGIEGQLGLEASPEGYVAAMVAVFRECWRALKPSGTCWLNLGDSYATGAGKVGDCPGGGEQGERWKQYGPARMQVPDGKNPKAGIPTYQPNRMPIAGFKPKDLVGIPWRVAFALQGDGWWLRSEIIWAKPNPMPESVRDRPTRSHEYVFLLTKNERYYYDADAISEPLATNPKENYPARARVTGRGTQGAAVARGNDRDKSGGFPPRRKSGNKERKIASGKGDRSRINTHLGSSIPWEDTTGRRNRRSVWNIATKPFPGAHFAVMPERLAALCVLAGAPHGGLVLDPFAGAGTVGFVAARYGRRFVGCDLKMDYCRMAAGRIAPHEEQATML